MNQATLAYYLTLMRGWIRLRLTSRVVILFALITTLLPLYAPALGQDSPPSAIQESEELKKLKERNRLLEEHINKAEKEKKLLDIYLPKSDGGLPKGQIKLENEPFIETEIMAYQLMAEVARGFGRRLLGKMPEPYGQNKLFIYSEEEFTSPFFYQGYLDQMTLLEQRYQSLGLKATTDSGARGFSPALAVPIIEGLLGSAADIAQFFKTDTVIKGKTFDIEELSFVSQIAETPIGKGVKVIYPSVVSPKLFDTDSALIDRINKLYEQKVLASGEIARLAANKQLLKDEIARLQEKIDAEKDETKKQDLIKERDKNTGMAKQIDNKMVLLKNLNQLFEELVGSLLKPGDNVGITTLIKLLRAEKLHQVMDQNSYILVFKLKTGGNIKVETRTFRSDKMYHSSGVIATFALFNRDGHIIDAGLNPLYRGYVKIKSRDEDGEDLAPVTKPLRLKVANGPQTSSGASGNGSNN